MSMVHCDGCESYIDSDEDPDCFVEVGNMKRLHKEVVWCGSCREKHVDEAEHKESLVAALSEAKVILQQKAILNILRGN